MDDLIRRGTLLHEFSYSKSGTRYLERDCDNFLTDIHLIDAKKIIRNAPSVDAVEVVRCRDCRKRQVWNGISMCGLMVVNDNDHCSWGTRMDAHRLTMQ